MTFSRVYKVYKMVILRGGLMETVTVSILGSDEDVEFTRIWTWFNKRPFSYWTHTLSLIVVILVY